MKQKDIKLLWGRSGNRCAICTIELAFDEASSTESHPLGEQAHIVADKEDGPRGKSILSTEQRDGYANRILLCPTHHTKIDKAIKDYPVELLHKIKTEHEVWVRERLSDTDERDEVADEIYASLIDEAVDKCRLHSWSDWSPRTIEMEPRWEVDAPGRYEHFEVVIKAAIWPGVHRDLERSLQTLSRVFAYATSTYLKHAEWKRDHFVGPKFYKQLRGWDSERYQERFSEWESWQDTCQALIFEAAKATNWFADCVRIHINPRFFATAGRFVLWPGSGSDVADTPFVPQYTEGERNGLPNSLPARFEGIRGHFKRDIGEL